jgi:hypothetical protein
MSVCKKTKEKAVLFKKEAILKKANRISHRYNRLPLLPSRPGGVQQELVVSVCRCKGTKVNDKYHKESDGF